MTADDVTLTEAEREALADEVYRRLDPEGYGWASGDGPSAEEVLAAVFASDWLADRLAAAQAGAW